MPTLAASSKSSSDSGVAFDQLGRRGAGAERSRVTAQGPRVPATPGVSADRARQQRVRGAATARDDRLDARRKRV
jgi:hypothetical protein